MQRQELLNFIQLSVSFQGLDIETQAKILSKDDQELTDYIKFLKIADQDLLESQYDFEMSTKKIAHNHKNKSQKIVVEYKEKVSKKADQGKLDIILDNLL